MNDFFSHYEILDVGEKAGSEAIKNAYRSKALQYHPDRVSEHLKKKSEEIFKQIQEAYEVLANPEKRKKYDELLKNLNAGQPFEQTDFSGNPVLQVDKTRFEFKNLKWGMVVSDSLSVSNAGGGTLTGTIKAVYGWIVLSENIIDTLDIQKIEITIDTTILLAGQDYSEEIEIRTNGGNETIYVDISTAPLSNMDVIISLAGSIVSKQWFTPLFLIIILAFVDSLFIGDLISNHIRGSQERIETASSETGRQANEKPREKAEKKSFGFPKDKITVNEIIIREDGGSNIIPVAKDAGEVARMLAGYPQKEAVKDEIVDETGIFYPKTGAYYPIERARYPEFYRKCDLNHDGIVMLSELGKAQREFHKITDKYPEGDVDSIVREFVK